MRNLDSCSLALPLIQWIKSSGMRPGICNFNHSFWWLSHTECWVTAFKTRSQLLTISFKTLQARPILTQWSAPPRPPCSSHPGGFALKSQTWVACEGHPCRSSADACTGHLAMSSRTLAFTAWALEHGLWSQPNPGALPAAVTAVQLWTSSLSSLRLSFLPYKMEVLIHLAL